MNREDTIQQLKDAEVLGKGGAAFPVWQKWEGCGAAEGDLKYIICNSSEGELGLFKDLYVWRNYMDTVFRGIDCAIEFLGKSEVYIHINRDYFNELQPQLYKLMNDRKWKSVFHINIEENCYIGGEASALMNIIETGVAQPKPRTTRTVVKGLFEKPTLMQNVETFYDIAMILDGKYDNCRFSGVFGDGIEEKFVVRHGTKTTIAGILEQNALRPDFDYFVQIGGSASGLVLNKGQLGENIMIGAGSIEIFDRSKNNLLTFLRRLGDFYQREACGKCMGKKFAADLNTLVKTFETEEEVINSIDGLAAIINDMSKKTFCKLCKSFKQPFESYCRNILEINLGEEAK
jgi:NADH:ubiquinone oxidoreductase subunit F (NADH-binding)